MLRITLGQSLPELQIDGPSGPFPLIQYTLIAAGLIAIALYVARLIELNAGSSLWSVRELRRKFALLVRSTVQIDDEWARLGSGTRASLCGPWL